MWISNIGCVGPEGLTVVLDDILCLVGPNNTGKTTVLRAYELAAGKATFTETDLCKRAGDLPAAVELWIHIPTGTPNIAEKWKSAEGDLRLIRSRWEWRREAGWKAARTTWDPDTNDWAADTKAAGLDEVFTSRLPVPLRVGTLQDPEEEHKALLELVLQPIAQRLRTLQRETGSALRQALDAFIACAEEPVQEEREKVRGLKEDLNRAQGQIFPHLAVDLDIALGKLELDLGAQLTRNSGVRFTEWSDEVQWSQQGTGSQRALFWSLLQVRSRLQTMADLKTIGEKAVADRKKKVAKLLKQRDSVKKEDTKAAKNTEIKKLQAEIQKIEAAAAGPEAQTAPLGLALPGYMLLIDEPEVGLHPAAIQAASRYLYALAQDPSWQVILSSHAPSFIDPLQDHTTIVRLSRDEANPTPNTYRAAQVAFSTSEKENLKMLNRFDSGLAEMFFGQYPILIEGDTEFACFEWIMNRPGADWPLSGRPLLVRARGKNTLVLLIRMLRHFKVHFSVLHDSDAPYRPDGSANPAWNVNATLALEIQEARNAGIRVVHRVSIPTFELVHLPIEKDENAYAKFPVDREKPWHMLTALKGDEGASAKVEALIRELISPYSPEKPFDGDFHVVLSTRVVSWAGDNSVGDPRFFGSVPN